MAHFAKITSENLVERVIVVNDENCLDASGNESEEVGVAFCRSLMEGVWIQCSYNNNFRGVFPGKGFIYDPIEDIFIDPATIVEEPAAS